MTAAIPPPPLSPPQLAVIQAPQERGLPAPATPQPAATRLPTATPAASGRGRIIDIVV
jgi:hypothetical protein